MCTYQYKPLPGEYGHIRLAKILPGHFDDGIVIELSSSSFESNDPPSYDALSYVWGDRDHDGVISIRDIDCRSDATSTTDTNTLVVAGNLETALRHLRSASEPRVMWIDAICIDQTNLEERGLQVRMMGPIYRLAARVIIWLGPEASESDRALLLIEDLESQVEVDWLTWTMSPAPGATDLSLAVRDAELPFDSSDLTAIYHLFCRPYFDRLWIRQELFLAGSRAVVQCGYSSTTWAWMHKALFCINSKHCRKFALINEYRHRMSELNGLITQRVPMSLKSLRRSMGNVQCSDDRDRIYAVLELLKDDLSIVPDYHKTMAQVYGDATRRYIDFHEDLSILGECQLPPSGSRPSWVPDWSATAPASSPLTAFASCSSHLAAWHEFREGGVLKVAGVFVLTIEDLETVNIPTRDNYVIAKEIQAALDALKERGRLAANRSSYEAIARTLTCNWLAGSTVPRDRNRPDLDACIRVVADLMSGENSCEQYRFLDLEASQVLRAFVQRCNQAQVFTAGSSIGRVRGPVREGDHVYALVGSDSLIVLRPVSGSAEFLVVGECYMHNMAAGQALLGPLPETVSPVYILRPEATWPGFEDNVTGDIFLDDPRFGPLHVDLTEYRKGVEARDSGTRLVVDPELLRCEGIDIKYIELV